MRLVYIDGTYVREKEAKISVFDRSYLFSHGVYEGISVLDGRLVDAARHLKRLERSMAAADIPAPHTYEEFVELIGDLVKRNGLLEGFVYLQVSRGVEDRDYLVSPDVSPSVVAFTQEKALLDPPQMTTGIKVVTLPDIRWARRDIKAVGLLGPVLAKEEARRRGAQDAWMHENGTVTEGTSNNAYILTQDDILVTRHLSHEILHGVTRLAVLALAEKDGISVQERAFTVEEAYGAKEAFITSATTFVWPVIQIDETLIGDGRPGPVTRRLREHYIEAARSHLL